MPYPPGGTPPHVPTTREIVGTEFERADGTVDGHTHFAKVVGPSPAADLDAQVLQRKVELACGCYSPDAEVVGVCAACAAEGKTANVCKTHFAVCPCGTPCCWRHSRPTDDPTIRLCQRCSVSRKNDARSALAVDIVKRVAQSLVKRGPDQPGDER